MTKQTCAARFLVFDANFTSNVETARMGLSALTPHASPQAGEGVINQHSTPLVVVGCLFMSSAPAIRFNEVQR